MGKKNPKMKLSKVGPCRPPEITYYRSERGLITVCVVGIFFSEELSFVHFVYFPVFGGSQ